MDGCLPETLEGLSLALKRPGGTSSPLSGYEIKRGHLENETSSSTQGAGRQTAMGGNMETWGSGIEKRLHPKTGISVNCSMNHNYKDFMITHRHERMCDTRVPSAGY